MTAVALLVGAGFAVALVSTGLAFAGLAYVFRMDAAGRSESARKCRRDCRTLCAKCRRLAEPVDERISRAFRENGWIDMDTIRRFEQ